MEVLGHNDPVGEPRKELVVVRHSPLEADMIAEAVAHSAVEEADRNAAGPGVVDRILADLAEVPAEVPAEVLRKPVEEVGSRLVGADMDYVKGHQTLAVVEARIRPAVVGRDCVTGKTVAVVVGILGRRLAEEVGQLVGSLGEGTGLEVVVRRRLAVARKAAAGLDYSIRELTCL